MCRVTVRFAPTEQETGSGVTLPDSGVALRFGPSLHIPGRTKNCLAPAVTRPSLRGTTGEVGAFAHAPFHLVSYCGTQLDQFLS